MHRQPALLHSQPPTHTSSYHWRQWLLCEDYSLTSQQLHSFYTLKQQSNILFQGQNQRWDLIKSLYIEYFNTPAQISGKQWIRLGFQGQYPQTDFRGGGVLSLQLILRFVKNNKTLVQSMQNDKGNFFFAITAINICFFMKKYFHLADFLIPQKDKEIYCDRRALKNFCGLMKNDEEYFIKLHEFLLKWFYQRKWLQEQRKNQEKANQTLLKFNQLFQEFQGKVRNVFENFHMESWNDFERAWREY